MTVSFRRVALLAWLASATCTSAFQAVPSLTARRGAVKTSLMATIDRNSMVTNKEVADIKGDVFTPEEMEKRLENRSYLYPKHVEVVEDFSPVVDEMVNKIVSITPYAYFGKMFSFLSRPFVSYCGPTYMGLAYAAKS